MSGYVYEKKSTINGTPGSDIHYYDFGVSSKLLSERKGRLVKRYDDMGDPVATYRKLKAAGEAFDMHFDKITEEGELSSVVNGITLVLPNKGTDGRVLFDASDRNVRAERLVYNYTVMVEDIDEAGKTVVLSTVPADNRTVVIKKINNVLAMNKKAAARATQKAKERIDSYIESEKERFDKMSQSSVERFRLTRTNEEITAGYKQEGIEMITVPARVTKVENEFLICDILGLNIPGKLFRNDWSFQAAGKLSSYVSPGEVIDVCIKGINNNRTASGKLRENRAMYLVTRLPLLNNPWDCLELKKDDDIRVTCVNIKKNCWFGSVNDTELEVYGEYALERGITVRLGETYLCHVYRCDAAMRSIRVRPFRHLKQEYM